MINYDIVVIGGGPAGASAAFTLAKHNFNVCLIDKKVFPRDKLCGAMLTKRSKKIFSEVFAQDWNSVMQGQSASVKFYDKHSLASHVENYTEFNLTYRIDFDSYLLKLAKEAGAETILGQKISSIDYSLKRIVLTDKREISYKYLIGCDGVYSFVVRTLLGKKTDYKRLSFALEIEVAKQDVNYNPDCPEIFFGIVPWGYAWIFPKGEMLTVGIGSVEVQGKELLAVFKSFMNDRFGSVPEGQISGHHIPAGDYLKEPGKGDVLLCGDAVGFVDPLTGEGLAYAMQSGYLAARAIIMDSFSTETLSALDIYKRKLGVITRNIRLSNYLKLLVLPEIMEPVFLKSLPRSKSISRLYVDLLSDEIDYRKFFNLVMLKLVKNAPRLLKLLKETGTKTDGK
ncbi:MAG: geranylgeranyl reductase family protein [Candidatus Cloacimonetes bacterium]|nr:geranylgeranyl reductase family protein [Candidatus Cloacimonadota bacterium]